MAAHAGSDTSDYEAVQAEAEARRERVNAALEACSPETAQPVAWDDLFHPDRAKLAANPDLRETCISVEGLATWRRVMRDDVARYERERDGTYQAPAGQRLHVGLSGHERMEELGLHGHFVEGRVVAVLDECSGWVLGGFCHYEGGPILRLAALEAEPRKSYVFLRGKDVAATLGNLFELPTDIETTLLTQAQERAAAIAAGDRAGFDKVVNRGDGSSRQRHYEDYADLANAEAAKRDSGLWTAFFDTKSPYRSSGYLYGQRRAYGYTRKYDRGDGTRHALVCTCIQPRCAEASWPVNAVEAVVSTRHGVMCEGAYWTKGVSEEVLHVASGTRSTYTVEEGWKFSLPEPHTDYGVEYRDYSLPAD